MSLTDKGHQQAVKLAARWVSAPTHVATSPYLRTKLTARPTLARFPHVVQEVLPMEEFTYLEPSRWNGTGRDQRLQSIEAFWSTADSVYRDGPGAESFTDLLTRVQVTLDRLDRHPTGSNVLAFSHGQFMQAIRVSLMFPDWDAGQLMRHFWPYNKQFPILNTDCLEVTSSANGHWRLGCDDE